MFQRLLDAKAMVADNIKECQRVGITPLYTAAERGEIDTLTLILKYRPPLDAATNQGFTALHAAVLHNHIDIATRLVTIKANVNTIALAADSEETTPLLTAIQNQNLLMVKILINGRAEVNFLTKKHQHSPLSLAMESANLDIVQALLDAKADPHNPAPAIGIKPNAITKERQPEPDLTPTPRLAPDQKTSQSPAALLGQSMSRGWRKDSSSGENEADSSPPDSLQPAARSFQ